MNTPKHIYSEWLPLSETDSGTSQRPWGPQSQDIYRKSTSTYSNPMQLVKIFSASPFFLCPQDQETAWLEYHTTLEGLWICSLWQQKCLGPLDLGRGEDRKSSYPSFYPHLISSSKSHNAQQVNHLKQVLRSLPTDKFLRSYFPFILTATLLPQEAPYNTPFSVSPSKPRFFSCWSQTSLSWVVLPSFKVSHQERRGEAGGGKNPNSLPVNVKESRAHFP